mmetsp:Transcript_101271/g.285492  ORF Transcript_101271/g.285492 Transcript_101271/m.285492 type:complete len:299 (-) Transcript_101271:26-922(-)
MANLRPGQDAPQGLVCMVFLELANGGTQYIKDGSNNVSSWNPTWRYHSFSCAFKGETVTARPTRATEFKSLRNSVLPSATASEAQPTVGLAARKSRWIVCHFPPPVRLRSSVSPDEMAMIQPIAPGIREAPSASGTVATAAWPLTPAPNSARTSSAEDSEKPDASANDGETLPVPLRAPSQRCTVLATFSQSSWPPRLDMTAERPSAPSGSSTCDADHAKASPVAPSRTQSEELLDSPSPGITTKNALPSALAVEWVTTAPTSVEPRAKIRQRLRIRIADPLASPLQLAHCAMGSPVK